jgi:hypothetical protein
MADLDKIAADASVVAPILLLLWLLCRWIVEDRREERTLWIFLISVLFINDCNSPARRSRKRQRRR